MSPFYCESNNGKNWGVDESFIDNYFYITGELDDKNGIKGRKKYIYLLIDTTYLSKGPRILFPHKKKLTGHSKHQSGQISKCKVEKVDVCGGPHILIPNYNKACCNISKNAQNKKESTIWLLRPIIRVSKLPVDDGEWY